jgi:MFS transporter, DHA2 family, methylenomycin A resistance protein
MNPASPILGSELMRNPSQCPPAATSALSKALTLAAMSLGFGVVQLDVTIVNTAIDSIGRSIGGGIAALQWVVSAYTIMFAAIILTAGALGDRIGAKKVFIAGFGIFTFASLGCALAPSIGTLIAARAWQGIGAAVLVPNSLALLNRAYPNEKERSRAIGFWAAGASVALTFGPLAGGALIALAGWRSIFLVNLPIGLAGLWLTARYAVDTPRSPGRELDLPGQVTAIAALGSLAGAIIGGGGLGWTNPWIIAGLITSVVLLVLLILREHYARDPMLPLSLFQHRLFAITTLIGFLVNVAFYGLIFVFSLYFQRLNGLSAIATGMAFLPMMLAVLVANLFTARITERIGVLSVISVGSAIAGIGCLALLTVERSTNYLLMCAPLVAIGGGLGLLVPPLTSALLGSVEKSRSGIASGILNSMRQTGSVVGVALFGSLVAQPVTFISGMKESLCISAALFLLASAVTRLKLVHDK